MKNELFHVDIELLSSLKSGDKTALTVIYKTLWQPLFTYAFSILQDKSACEDIIQNVFVYLWEKKETLQVSSLKGYLYVIVRHMVFFHIKTAKMRVELSQDLETRLQDTSIELKMYEKETRYGISQIVGALPPRCQEIYRLSREDSHSYKTIASMLNISDRTVEHQISKALRILRNGLENYFA